MISRHARVVVPLVLVLALAACAAKGPRNRAQIGALTVGEAVLAISNAEQTIRTANFPEYTPVAQASVNAGILKALYASRGFERAVVQWPADGSTVNEAVDTARRGLELALADLEKSIPPIAKISSPLIAAVKAAQAALASWNGGAV